MGGLGPMITPDVVGEMHGLMGHIKEKGPDGLAKMLSHQHYPTGMHLRHWHTLVCAVDDEDDTVFSLMEMRAEDETGKPRSFYQILKTEWMLDDVSRAATHLLERGQWDKAMVPPTGPDTAAFLPPFTAPIMAPMGSGLGAEQLKASSRTWCRARCSGADARALMDPLVAPEFRMWDAYGMLPNKADMEGDSMKAGAVYRMLEANKAEYDVEIAPIDVAASNTHNVVFMHLRCSMKPRGSAKPAAHMECMEMDVYNPQGQLAQVWMFRDASEAEKHMVQQRQQAALRAAADAEDEERSEAEGKTKAKPAKGGCC
ncbi:hypothetical protein HYH03_017519 [Edaphochlamys debaryana]|uniref:SnoaL-like domain-containing protein n=1 Tax=Edaphochlamys debaryana TaxID=47281 RepID=A0A836BP81_9CHLO|nr:hypothetical protein HYH03_017519 [Edaphochlamys debaryana]|eukprot:KAG2483642.1 hypothetical protein HYH03_017519 [Edaphochlamys debaryana]